MTQTTPDTAREAVARVIQREHYRPTCTGAALGDICALAPKPWMYAAADRILALNLPASAEVRLKEALAERDRKASECPDAKLDPDKDCPRCGANSNEGCRLTILADAGFVHNARAALDEVAK